MTTARSRARAFMWRRTASSRRCDSAQKTPLRWLENGSGSPVATNAMPTPEPRYSNPASSSESVMPRSSFAIGVLAPNRNAEPSASIRGGDLSRGSGLYDSPQEGDGFELLVRGRVKLVVGRRRQRKSNGSTTPLSMHIGDLRSARTPHEGRRGKDIVVLDRWGEDRTEDAVSSLARSRPVSVL